MNDAHREYTTWAMRAIDRMVESPPQDIPQIAPILTDDRLANCQITGMINGITGRQCMKRQIGLGGDLYTWRGNICAVSQITCGGCSHRLDAGVWELVKKAVRRQIAAIKKDIQRRSVAS
jgi:hypothetical protein